VNKGEILVTIHEMRGEYAYKSNEELKRIGKMALEGAPIYLNMGYTRAYYEAHAKLSVLDELLEKIVNTPDDDGKVKSNSFFVDIPGSENAV
jgi:hypothetical protein